MTTLSDDALLRLSDAPRTLQPALDDVREELTALDSLAQARPGEVSRQLMRAVQPATRALTELEAHLRSGLELPLTVALMGGTNTGKSTTLNLIAGREVSREKVTANATKRPLIYAHARWREALLSAQRPWPRPELSEDSGAPVTQEASLTPLLRLHEDERLRELILIDCPDLDSTETMNLHSATDITRWADRALFLVTPQKYKDELLVQALHSLVERGQRVHVLFNLITERHERQEMCEDLEQSLSLTGAERVLLTFEEPLERLPREREASQRDALQTRLLRPLLEQDHQGERRALLALRASRALIAIEQALEGVTLAEEALEELGGALEGFLRRATRAMTDALEEVGDAHSARVEATLHALSLPTLIDQLSAVIPIAQRRPAREGTPVALVVALRALKELTKGALSWVSAQLIMDATRRLGGGAGGWGTGEARSVLMSALHAQLQELSATLERYARPQGEGAEEGQVFTLKSPPPSAQDGARFSSDDPAELGALRAPLSELALRELTTLIASPTTLEATLDAQQMRSVEGDSISATKRAQMLALKGLCGVSLAYLTLGLGAWDFVWSPLGFELGSYLIAWRLGQERAQGGGEASGPRAESEQVERALIRGVVAPVGREAELKLWPVGDLKQRRVALARARASLVEGLS